MAEYSTIPALTVENLDNKTHFEAMTDVRDRLRDDSGLTNRLGAAVTAFNNAVQAEASALEETAKSPYTEMITRKDDERDSTLALVKALIRNTALTGTGQAKQSAEYIQSMAKIMKVVTHSQYDKETGDITIACNELLGKYATYTEAAGVKTQVELLQRLNDEMCQLLQLRDAERGEQGKSKVHKCRQDSDAAYRELVRQVNALEIAFAIGQLQGQPEDDPFTPFINFMLGLIDRYKREILNRKKPDKEETVTDEVTEEVTQTPEGEETTETDTETDTETTLTPDTRKKK